MHTSFFVANLSPVFVTTPLQAEAIKGKARKRQRDGKEASTPSKKVKEDKSDVDSSKMDKGGEASLIHGLVQEAGEQHATKTGFFSGEKFSDLPLSEGMFAALKDLNFVTTTKIQASHSIIRTASMFK